MRIEEKLRNLEVPSGPIDVVLDTDAYAEIDDQFAITYLLKSKEKLNTKAIYAAPLFQLGSVKAGMERSYEEIMKLLSLLKMEENVLFGSCEFLSDENTPVISPAALDLAERVENYSPRNPLYVVAIGAITNIASAIMLNPKVKENTVIVWLGGHAHHYHDTKEFNMRFDYAAARVVMSSGVPLVQLPCMGVVSAFTVSKPELEYWLLGKNPIATYLAENTIKAADSYALGKPWTRPIWDVTAVAWLLNEGDRFMNSRIERVKLPDYDGKYSSVGGDIRYVYHIKRDSLMEDLINKILS